MTDRDLFGHVARHSVIHGEEYAVEVLKPETLEAVRVRTADIHSQVIEIWLPKSQIAVRPLTPPHAMVTIPDWIARKHGLME
jgi:hypothetical protein